jgi:hypothetical protein
MRNRLIAVAACAMLTACAGPSGGPGGNIPPVEDRPISRPQQQPGTVARPAPPQQAAIDPANLVGMTGERITALFGAPVFVRRDPPGEFWRYRGESCVLELFFYPEAGAQRVDHIETRNAGDNPQDRADCLATLRKPAARS